MQKAINIEQTSNTVARILSILHILTQTKEGENKWL